MSTTEAKSEKEDKSFIDWLMEDDAPNIGIATKEPLPEYVEGVKTEFKRIEWPSKEQLGKEFVSVVIIVAIISIIIYVIDLGLDNLIKPLVGG